MAIAKMFDVTGKHVIVTGASRGLGRGMAEGYLENGAKVVMMSNDVEELHQAVEENRAKGYDAYEVAGDLSNLDEMNAMFDKAMEMLDGVLDVLIPAAGAIVRIDPDKVPLDTFMKIQQINLYHPYFMAQRAMKVMMNQKDRGRAKIIFITSVGVFRPGPRVSPYSASKGGLYSVAKCFASDLAPYGINVNMICPGYFATKLTSDIPADQRERAQVIPLGRFGEPEDIKGLALFLGSAASDYITGENIVIDGGFTNRL